MLKYKMGEDGKPVYQDGKLILLLDDGSETTFDALGAYSTFGAIRDERDRASKAASKAEQALALFGSTEEDRKKALDKVKLADNFDSKKLVEAGKVDELVAQRLSEATAAWNGEKAGLEKAVAEARSNVRRHLISSRFATSKALEKTVLTPDLAEAKFGALFDVEGDSIVAYKDHNKQDKVYSRSEPAKVADFDEALSILLTSDPNFSKWKAGSGASGGAAAGSTTNNGDAKVMVRSEFDGLAPAAKMAAMKSGVQLVDGA